MLDCGADERGNIGGRLEWKDGTKLVRDCMCFVQKLIYVKILDFNVDNDFNLC